MNDICSVHNQCNEQYITADELMKTGKILYGKDIWECFGSKENAMNWILDAMKVNDINGDINKDTIEACMNALRNNISVKDKDNWEHFPVICVQEFNK